MGRFFDIAHVLGLAGLLLAIYLYFKSLRSPKLVYKHTRLTLLGEPTSSLPPELQVSYKGKAVEHLKKSWIIFWNAGNKEIRRSEVSSSNPLTITCKDGILLDIQIVKVTTAATNWHSSS